MHLLFEAMGGARPLKWITALALAVVLAPGAALAQQQQHADLRFRPKIRRPGYAGGGPVVVVDSAHRNFHVLDGRYAPFGKLLGADGYQLRDNTTGFSAQSLAGVDVLVIANARSSSPGDSAFTPDEIGAVRDWVERGGSLLLIADHAPFGIAAKALAQAFGVNLDTGFAVVRQDGRITANIDFRGRLLGHHPILEGRDPSERVKEVRSFTGESMSIPVSSAPLLLLPSDALGVLKETDIDTLAHGGAVPGMRIGGRAQAIAESFGRGRLVVAGEAAMFTEQIMPWGDRVGLNSVDDEQFVLNVMHWLSRLI